MKFSRKNDLKSESRLDEKIKSCVPNASHYRKNYLRGGRFFSFAHQVEEILAFNPNRVLEIGPGPGIVTFALRTAGLDVITLDIEPSNHTDVLGSVEALPFCNRAVDVILCCQVLEHLPLNCFIPALCELKRVALLGCIISLPDITPSYCIHAKLPLFPNLNYEFSRVRLQIPDEVPNNRYQRDGHFWEIGLKRAKPRIIRRSIRDSGWNISSEFRNIDFQYHRFFILKHKQDKRCL